MAFWDSKESAREKALDEICLMHWTCRGGSSDIVSRPQNMNRLDKLNESITPDDRGTLGLRVDHIYNDRMQSKEGIFRMNRKNAVKYFNERFDRIGRPKKYGKLYIYEEQRTTETVAGPADAHTEEAVRFSGTDRWRLKALGLLHSDADIANETKPPAMQDKPQKEFSGRDQRFLKEHKILDPDEKPSSGIRRWFR